MEKKVKTTGTPIETTYGTFTASFQTSPMGVSIQLAFRPHPDGKAAKQPVGLIQTTRLTRTQMSLSDQYKDEPSKLKRMTTAGTHIDQSTYTDPSGEVLTEAEAETFWKEKEVCIPQTNPVYNATNSQDKTARSLLDYTEPSDKYGRIYDPDHPSEPARLFDSPGRIILESETLEHTFETVALTLTKPYRYLGSVTWGYKIVSGKLVTQATLTPYVPTKCSDGIPTEEFLASAALWNGQGVVDYSLSERVARVAIPIPTRKKVTAENLEARFDDDIAQMIGKGVKGEYRAKDGKPWQLIAVSEGIYTFLTYEE